jgi:hypothetical protein
MRSTNPRQPDPLVLPTMVAMANASENEHLDTLDSSAIESSLRLPMFVRNTSGAIVLVHTTPLLMDPRRAPDQWRDLYALTAMAPSILDNPTYNESLEIKALMEHMPRKGFGMPNPMLGQFALRMNTPMGPPPAIAALPAAFVMANLPDPLAARRQRIVYTGGSSSLGRFPSSGIGYH